MLGCVPTRALFGIMLDTLVQRNKLNQTRSHGYGAHGRLRALALHPSAPPARIPSRRTRSRSGALQSPATPLQVEMENSFTRGDIITPNTVYAALEHSLLFINKRTGSSGSLRSLDMKGGWLTCRTHTHQVCFWKITHRASPSEIWPLRLFCLAFKLLEPE